ncbi:hypothetical protein FOMPIDRAFT_84350 [Fomitopsis schrenkii]|uniref:Major facilitator superfamily (MFS) profile domain-containing protein n=1 Tax=Fomitopsis schrenkii TaxID=2126942 RepID=S8EQV8_FOMSC|nr:hypothetical protein FOMPIDRAFT_84350 [Fomitopsis schrenkii]
MDATPRRTSSDEKASNEGKSVADIVVDEAGALHTHTRDLYGEDDSGVDPVYEAKAKMINDAFEEIGMGRYQWWLFIVTGFGWFADNLYPIITGLILSAVSNEFHFQSPYLKLAQSLGQLVGCTFWGIASDVWGRRWCFNLTLLITGVFSITAGASTNKVALCGMVAAWSVGVGGNLPVDSAVFLEFTPATHQYLLTVLSIWWAVGQLVGSLVAWPLLTDFSCASAADCPRSSNMGWRYFLYSMGGLMMVCWFLRFLFHLHESPKFLIGRGRDAEAVKVMQAIAEYNGRTCSLTLDQLVKANELAERMEKKPVIDMSAKGAMLRKLKTVSGEHVKSLFATKKLAWSTSLLIAIWALIGLAFPLYNGFIVYYLQTRGTDFGDGSLYITYRNQVILSAVGMPGAFLAGWMVELPYLGRRGTMGVSTVITGVFLFAATTARTSNALLAWNCAYTLTSNVMYGVLYAVSPELFPTRDRGTGNAIVSAANHTTGVIAPLVALYGNLATSVPIYVAGAMFIGGGVLSFLLPYEPRGKASI